MGQQKTKYMYLHEDLQGRESETSKQPHTYAAVSSTSEQIQQDTRMTALH